MEATGGTSDPPARPPAAAAASLVWFRSDLRLADHEPLYTAAAQAPQLLLPFYFLDERELAAPSNGGGSLGIPQLGPHRLRWVLPLVPCMLWLACQAVKCSLPSVALDPRCIHPLPPSPCHHRAGCCWRAAPACGAACGRMAATYCGGRAARGPWWAS